MSESDNSVTMLIQQLHAGTPEAAEQLWNRYFPQLLQVARNRLKGARYASADEEDVALSAFKSLCIGAQEGRFPHLSDRDSLWSLLVSITAHKSVDLIRRENRQKRGGTGAAKDGGERVPAEPVPLSSVEEQEADPEFAALIGEQFELLVSKLDQADDADLLTIAIARMVGESTSDIADRLQCTRRTIERKVQLVRHLWEEEIDTDS